MQPGNFFAGTLPFVTLPGADKAAALPIYRKLGVVALAPDVTDF